MSKPTYKLVRTVRYTEQVENVGTFGRTKQENVFTRLTWDDAKKKSRKTGLTAVREVEAAPTTI